MRDRLDKLTRWIRSAIGRLTATQYRTRLAVSVTRQSAAPCSPRAGDRSAGSKNVSARRRSMSAWPVRPRPTAGTTRQPETATGRPVAAGLKTGRRVALLTAISHRFAEHLHVYRSDRDEKHSREGSGSLRQVRCANAMARWQHASKKL